MPTPTARDFARGRALKIHVALADNSPLKERVAATAIKARLGLTPNRPKERVPGSWLGLGISDHRQ
jgi:hypothetical protein